MISLSDTSLDSKLWLKKKTKQQALALNFINRSSGTQVLFLPLKDKCLTLPLMSCSICLWSQPHPTSHSLESPVTLSLVLRHPFATHCWTLCHSGLLGTAWGFLECLFYWGVFILWVSASFSSPFQKPMTSYAWWSRWEVWICMMKKQTKAKPNPYVLIHIPL